MIQPTPTRDLWLGIGEVLGVICGLGFVACYTPLSSENFMSIIAVVCITAVIYGALRLALYRGTAERWGLPFSQKQNPAWSLQSLESDTLGCVVLGGFILAGAAPILVMRMLSPHAVSLSHPATYLIWCMVQDFLFFALVFRNLEDWMPVEVAIIITAALFGLSHYPYSVLVVLTAFAGGVWAYAFSETRSLILINAAHWLMGIMLLG